MNEDNYLTDEEYKAKHPDHCGKRCEVYSRVVGYLRPTDQWNIGKKQEFQDRKTFKRP